MRLGDTTIPCGVRRNFTLTAKQVIHQPDWSDRTDVTDMGLGAETFDVLGWLETEEERLDIIAACNAARSEVTNLYFPSVQGGDDDRYQTVITGPANCEPVDDSVALYRCTFHCVTSPYPYEYNAATGERVT